MIREAVPAEYRQGTGIALLLRDLGLSSSVVEVHHLLVALALAKRRRCPQSTARCAGGKAV